MYKNTFSYIKDSFIVILGYIDDIFYSLRDIVIQNLPPFWHAKEELASYLRERVNRKRFRISVDALSWKNKFTTCMRWPVEKHLSSTWHHYISKCIYWIKIKMMTYVVIKRNLKESVSHLLIIRNFCFFVCPCLFIKPFPKQGLSRE